LVIDAADPKRADAVDELHVERLTVRPPLRHGHLGVCTEGRGDDVTVDTVVSGPPRYVVGCRWLLCRRRSIHACDGKGDGATGLEQSLLKVGTRRHRSAQRRGEPPEPAILLTAE
jgi:hypothetical protein